MSLVSWSCGRWGAKEGGNNQRDHSNGLVLPWLACPLQCLMWPSSTPVTLTAHFFIALFFVKRDFILYNVNLISINSH